MVPLPGALMTNGLKNLLTHRVLPLSLTLALAACGGELADETYGDQSNLDAESTICPGTSKVYGIDVSYYQGNINWTAVKGAGKQFAIVRVSDGTGFHDPKFATNWHGAKAAGILVGAYQFFRPTQDVNAQADLMVSQLKSVGYGSGDLPPVLDVEVTDGVSAATIASRVNAWLLRVKNGTGRMPVMYTSPGFWGGLGSPTPNPLPYLWVAHWGVSCPNLPKPWGRLRFWQYSDKGSVAGISGAVDLDMYNGSLSELAGL